MDMNYALIAVNTKTGTSTFVIDASSTEVPAPPAKYESQAVAQRALDFLAKNSGPGTVFIGCPYPDLSDVVPFTDATVLPDGTIVKGE